MTTLKLRHLNLNRMKKIGIVAFSIFSLCSIVYAATWQGGILTFGNPVRVDDTGASLITNVLPSMVFDDFNNIYVVWQDLRTGSPQIFFSESTNSGASFSTNVNISNNLAMPCSFPVIYRDGSGVLYVTFQADDGTNMRIYLTKSADNGTTWTTPIIASNNITGYNYPSSRLNAFNFGPQPRVCVNSAISPAITYLCWTNYDNVLNSFQTYIAASQDFFATSVTAYRISQVDNVCRHPFFTLDANGRIYVCWEQSLSGNTNDPNPDLAFNAFDYNSVSQTYTRIFSDYSTNPNGFKDVLVNLDGPSTNAAHIHPAMDVIGGKLYIAWEDERDGAPNIYMDSLALSAPGTTKEFPSNILVTAESSIYEHLWPSLGLAPNGDLVFAWHDKRNNSFYQIYMCSGSSTGTNFSASQSITTTNTGSNSGSFGSNLYPPCLKVKSSAGMDNFYLVWQDFARDPNGDILFIRGWVSYPKENLEEFKVYPNPFVKSRGDKAIIFANVTKHVEIKIYTVNGDRVASIVKDGVSMVLWEPANIASGVYIYTVLGKNDNGQSFKKSGKIAIIK